MRVRRWDIPSHALTYPSPSDVQIVSAPRSVASLPSVDMPALCGLQEVSGARSVALFPFPELFLPQCHQWSPESERPSLCRFLSVF